MRLFLLLLISMSLYAQTPRIYASLADPIYDNLSAVASLSTFEGFAEDKARISSYVQNAVDAKVAGDAIAEKQEGAMDRKAYLNTLRALSKEHTYFTVKANRQFRQTMQNDDCETFASLIKTDLIDMMTFEKEMLEYYTSSTTCKPIEEMDMYIAYKKKGEEKAQMSKQKRQQSYREYKENRIERFRARDRAEKEAYEKQLREETERTKADVRAELKSELRR